MNFGREHPLAVLRRVDWWLVLVATAIALVGLVFIHSATRYDTRFAGQHLRQTLFLAVSAGLGSVVVLVPYPRVMRLAWVLYAAVVVALLLLPFFGSVINGARRWYTFPGFAIQPSEFAKLIVIIALAAWFRFLNRASFFETIMVPTLITGIPAFLVMRQPDLGSSLVFWPILLAMCHTAGASAKQLILFAAGGAIVALLAGTFLMQGYQQKRVDAWAAHFSWTAEGSEKDLTVQKQIRDSAYQPWQSLIAVGAGGWTGFGLGEGPQNRYDFLPYRNADYVFSVVAEEQGLVGVLLLMGLQGLLVLLLLRVAFLSRERFGRLLTIGVATFLGTQSLMHIAVCTWFVPSTGLPMPLVSYGGSSTMVAVLAIALAVGVGARRQPVVAADAFA